VNNASIKKTSKRIISISFSLTLLLSILCNSFLGTCQAAAAKQYTIAAWEFTAVESSDIFWATHGTLKNGASLHALTDREMTTSKVSIDGGVFLGTVYCGDWGFHGNSWRIKVSTEGYKNISLTFASYGVAGAPRNFRIDTETGEILTRFTSGTAATTGNFTRVNISLPGSYNNQQDILIYIIQEDNTSVNGGTVKSGNGSNSRLGDISISGEKINETVNGTVIAAWEFTEATSNNGFFDATNGPLADSAKLLAQTGRTATTSRVSVSDHRFLGTIYSGDWNNGGYWEIDFSTEGYKNITLSFASYGVAGAPRNFRVEDDTGNILARFASGTSATDATYINLTLPSYFDDGDGSIYIYMDDTVSVSGGTVQSGNASNSRLGDIVISGVKLSNETGGEFEPLTLSVQADRQYTVCVRGEEVSNLNGIAFAISYDPVVLEPTDLCAFTWKYELDVGAIAGSDITIISFTPGEIVFTVDKSISTDTEWSGVLNVIRFHALSTGDTTILVRDPNPNP
jgi:hypothetical protein